MSLTAISPRSLALLFPLPLPGTTTSARLGELWGARIRSTLFRCFSNPSPPYNHVRGGRPVLLLPVPDHGWILPASQVGLHRQARMISFRSIFLLRRQTICIDIYRRPFLHILIHVQPNPIQPHMLLQFRTRLIAVNCHYSRQQLSFPPIATRIYTPRTFVTLFHALLLMIPCSSSLIHQRLCAANMETATSQDRRNSPRARDD